MLIHLAAVTSAIGQEEKIQADRPGETLTPQLTKRGYFQVETGFEREQKNKTDYLVTHPEVLLKYGLSNRFELRAALFAESERKFSKN